MQSWLLIVGIHLCISLKVDFIPPARSPPPPRHNLFTSYLQPRESFIIFGGSDTEQFFSDIWEFSLVSFSWEKVFISSLESPAPRCYSGGFSSFTESKFYIFGGLSNSGPEGDFWEFDFVTHKWQKIEIVPRPPSMFEYAFTTYAEEGIQYFIIQAGATWTGNSDDIYRFNLTAFEWEKLPNNGEAPLTTWYAFIHYYDGNLLQYSENPDTSPYLYSYSLKNFSWSIVSEMNDERIGTGSRSFLYNNELYVMFYWRDTINGEKSIFRKVNLLEEKKEWKYFDPFPDWADYIDAALVETEDTIFIFGSYTWDTFRDISNTLGIISLEDFSYDLIGSHFIQPPARSYHSMVAINTKLYVFGGIDSDTLFNDLWTFDLISEVWELVQAKGDIPSKRFLHSAGSDGDIFVVWGGESFVGLKNDLFIFNSITGHWAEVKPVTSFNPSPAKGACLALKNFKVVLYGGERNGVKSNELWEYDLGTNQFQLLSDEGLQTVISPFCWIDDDLFYVSLGRKSNGNGSNQIDFFNFSSMTWNIFHHDNGDAYPPSVSSQVMVGDYLITIGGQLWNSYPSLSIRAFLQGEEILSHEDDIDQISYAAGFTYFEKSLYIFGGGRGFYYISPLVGSPLFYKIDIEDICSYFGCKALCSAGTYISNDSCETCKSGTYSDKQGSATCQECHPGSFNNKTAATSKFQCIPCPQGFYSNETGASECHPCPNNSFCPVGSINPSSFQSKQKSSSHQPSLYKEADISEDLLLFRLLVIIPSIALVLCLLSVSRLRNYLAKLDMYDVKHNYEQGNFMKKKQTKIGGLCTVIFVLACLMVTCTAILTFSKANIQETKGQVPLVIMESELSPFESKFISFELFLKSYGGQCGDSSECASSIKPELLNIKCSQIIITCMSNINNTCTVQVSCKEGEIQTGAQVNFEITEHFSYTTEIQATITSSSSIPREDSSVSTVLLPNDASVFIGSVASEFYFLATPSLFQSESTNWEREITGYHISERTSPLPGSQHFTEDLPFVSNLYVKLFIEINSSVLITKRLLKQDGFFFVGALLGTVSGLFGLTGLAMSFVEQQYERVSKRFRAGIVSSDPEGKMFIKENSDEKSKNDNVGALSVPDSSNPLQSQEI